MSRLTVLTIPPSIDILSGMPIQSTVLEPSIILGVGARFRRARRSFGLTLDEIAEDIKIRPDLLRAIEEGALGCIEESVYRALMVRSYAEYLGIEWSTISDEYLRESVYMIAPDDTARVNTGNVQRADLLVAPRLFKHIVLSAGMIAVCLYLAVLAGSALQRPALTIFNPPDNFLSSSKTLRIEGEVSPDAALSINGQEVVKATDGSFMQEVTLSEGMNSIRISATKQYSKETTVVRKVLYERPSLSYNK